MKVFSRGGVGVYDDYRENIVVCQDHPVLRWKAEKERFPSQFFAPDVGFQFPKGLSRVASCNSEDVLSWNVFRSIEKACKLDMVTGLLGLPVVLETASFWNRRDGPSIPHDIQAVLNCMEPWGSNGRLQQTETDVMLVGNQHKWDSLGPERSDVWKSLGELPEGPVMKSSLGDGLSLHLLPAL